MSVIPSAVAQMGQMTVAASPIDIFFMGINTNPYFIGLMMLLLNLGGRFISLEMSKGQEAFFADPWVRRILIFTILFVGTRNFVVAFILWFVIILCIGYLFNENSSLCIFKFGIPGSTCKSKENFQNDMPSAPMPSMPSMPSMPTVSGPLIPQGQAQGQAQGNLTKEETSILNQLQAKLQQGQGQSPNGPVDKSEIKDVIGMYFKAMDSLQGAKL